jgi:predicted Zn-dependent protease
MTPLFGRTKNISEGGLLIETPDTAELHTRLSVRFVLPLAPVAIAVEAEAVVARVNPGKYMAIRFFGLRDDYRKAVARFIEQALEP